MLLLFPTSTFEASAVSFSASFFSSFLGSGCAKMAITGRSSIKSLTYTERNKLIALAGTSKTVATDVSTGTRSGLNSCPCREESSSCSHSMAVALPTPSVEGSSRSQASANEISGRWCRWVATKLSSQPSARRTRQVSGSRPRPAMRPRCPLKRRSGRRVRPWMRTCKPGRGQPKSASARTLIRPSSTQFLPTARRQSPLTASGMAPLWGKLIM
mmetsp:Transcript_52246/g.169738  ORF Transcript_52246/g.169738 Transcript_52246/m.169738 type:complete len:214 (-) Transcript_52246:474-1115(-)